MLKRRLLGTALALTSLLGAGKALPELSRGTALAAVDAAAAEQQLLDLLNLERAAGGLTPLQADDRLMDVARWRSEDMVARNFFGHDIGGFTISRILRERHVTFAVAGENLVANTFNDASTVAKAHAELMNSATHRENILRAEYDHVGVGVAVAPTGRTVYTQVFIQAPPER